MYQFYESSECAAGHLRSIQIIDDKCRLSFKLDSESCGTDFYIINLLPFRDYRHQGLLSGICSDSGRSKSKVSGTFHKIDSSVNLKFFVENRTGSMVWKEIRLDVEQLTITANSCCLN